MSVEIEDISVPTMKIKVGKKGIELTEAEAKELQDELNKRYADRVPYRFHNHYGLIQGIPSWPRNPWDYHTTGGNACAGQDNS